jgi:hypothetical protein
MEHPHAVALGSGAMIRRRAVAVVLVCGSLALGACGDDDGDDAAPEGDAQPTSVGVHIGDATEGVEGVQAYRVESRDHTEGPLAYDLSPPVGGDHFPVPGTCGFYESDPPPDELVVHSLEHGAVWVAYDPGLDDAQLDVLRDLVARQAKVIATPYDGLDSALVVSAWGRQLALDSVDDPRLGQFVETYRNSDESPEPDAACQGAGDPAVASPTA